MATPTASSGLTVSFRGSKPAQSLQKLFANEADFSADTNKKSGQLSLPALPKLRPRYAGPSSDDQ